MLKITRIKLPLANAYLVQGRQTILVDTGAPGDETRILAAMAQAGVTPNDLALILLTHGHGDHAGSAAALTRETGVPVALHRADLGQVQAGRNDRLNTTGLEARLVRPFVDKPFPALTPSLLLDDGVSLIDLGVDLGADAHVLPTPGHTWFRGAAPVGPGRRHRRRRRHGRMDGRDATALPAQRARSSMMPSRSRTVWIDRWR
ncbi:MAG: MBL fold metallo-hydrolase [Caldilineaceae bacterium]